MSPNQGGPNRCFRLAKTSLLLLLPLVSTQLNLAQTAAPASHSAGAKFSSPTKRLGQKPATVPPLFVDVTRAAGIDFHLTCGSREKLYILETQCGGAAALDYDNDGWMDILLVDGSTINDYRVGKCHPPRLYRNNRDGTFADVSAKSGLNFCGWGYGVAVGDYDNDGWADIYITGFHGSALYHNNHDGTFTDVTAKAGVANAAGWGTSAAFGDYDNDGNLDLYVANYVDLDIDNLPKFGGTVFCQYRGIPVNCGPRGLKGSRGRLFHNNGDGTFADVTEKLGLDPHGDRENHYGLGVLWLDYDKDGCLDLYVANDSSPSLLYHNNCHGGFTEVGVEAGVAYSPDGREQAGMGTDSSDYDREGWPGILKTNFSDDANNLYHNDGKGEFTDDAGAAGLGGGSHPYLGFGAKFLDYDNDGWPDIFIANGHVDPQVDGQSFGVSYAEPPFLFHNLGGQVTSDAAHRRAAAAKPVRFEEVAQNSGGALARKYVGRAALSADFWNRGRQDLLVTDLDASPVLLRNVVPVIGHWLEIKTVGVKSNDNGFGARIEITAAGSTRYAEVRAGGSFESSSDPRTHFGLGAATKVDAITIHWPSGQSDKLGPEAADQELVITEGHGVTLRNPAKTKPQ